jgi:hypothetical protein
MENSNAYHQFIEQIDAVGSKCLDGYNSSLLESIYDWEVDKVEDIIWDRFCEKTDTDLAIFLPKLKKYNGIEMLKKKINDCEIPSSNSLNIAIVLYDNTQENEYFEIIKANYNGNTEINRMIVTAQLTYIKCNKLILEYFIQVYVEDQSSKVRSVAVTGMLRCLGYINDPLNLQEVSKNLKLRKLFYLEEINDRKDMINKFLNNEIILPN